MANIGNSTLDAWLNQFRLTGFPNGIDLHGCSRVGMTYQLTSAQLLALNTPTPVSIVPAPVTSLVPVPPNGYAFRPYALSAEYVAGTTAYTLAGTNPAINVVYHGKTTALLTIAATGFIDQTSDQVEYVNAVSPGGPFTLANCQNLGLDVVIGGTATPGFTTGNGYVNLFLEYGVICLF
jgi:hypothetical protein